MAKTTDQNCSAQRSWTSQRSSRACYEDFQASSKSWMVVRRVCNPSGTFQCHAIGPGSGMARTQISLPQQATDPQSKLSLHVMHKIVALIRYTETATRRLCMYGGGEKWIRDGEVLSLRTRFQDQLELFGLVLCDIKLSFSNERMYERRAVCNTGAPTPKHSTS
jgi:hypothetical protein